MTEEIKYYVADQYGCPQHTGGHSDRKCGCRFFWCEDYNPLHYVEIANSEMDQEEINKAAKEYEEGTKAEPT